MSFRIGLIGQSGAFKLFSPRSSMKFDFDFLQGASTIDTTHPSEFAADPPSFLDIMLRTAAVRALRAASTPRIARPWSSIRPQISPSFLSSSHLAPSFAIQSIRCYSAPSGLSKEEVQGRIMDLLKNFDKVRNVDVPFGKLQLTKYRSQMLQRYTVHNSQHSFFD